VATEAKRGEFATSAATEVTSVAKSPHDVVPAVTVVPAVVVPAAVVDAAVVVLPAEVDAPVVVLPAVVDAAVVVDPAVVVAAVVVDPAVVVLPAVVDAAVVVDPAVVVAAVVVAAVVVAAVVVAAVVVAAVVVVSAAVVVAVVLAVVVVVVVVVVAVLLFILFIEAVVVAELALLAAIATTWSERSLLVTPWAIDAFSEASVLAAEQASMAETTLSSSFRQAPKALVQFFLAAVKSMLRVEMSQAVPLIFAAAMARLSAVHKSHEASPLAAKAGFVMSENASMNISHSIVMVSLWAGRPVLHAASMLASHISNSIMRALRLSAPGVPEALLHKRLLAFPPPAARSLLIRGAKMACLLALLAACLALEAILFFCFTKFATLPLSNFK